MKYKVGDVVKVRDGLKVGESYGSNSFVSGMRGYSQVTISGVKEDRAGYPVEENDYYYTEEMLGSVVNKKHKTKEPVFKKGDVVTYVGSNTQLHNVRAVVVGEYKNVGINSIALDFGKLYEGLSFDDDTVLHNLGGKLDGDFGYWVNKDDIKSVSDTPCHSTPKFAIGDVVTIVDYDSYINGMRVTVVDVEGGGRDRYTVKFDNPSQHLVETRLHTADMNDGKSIYYWLQEDNMEK